MSQHQVQQTPSTASSQVWLSPTPSQFLIFRWMLLYPTLYIPTVTSWPMNRVSAPVAPASRSTATKNSSNHDRSWPPSVSLNTLKYGLQVLLQTRSIMASKCISELTQCCLPSASPNSLDHGLQVHLQARPIATSKCISKLHHALLMHLWVRSISVSKCISKLTRSWPPSPSLRNNGGFMEI